MMALVALGMVMAMLFGFGLTAVVSTPLSRSVKVIEELGRGHLGHRLNLSRKDEIGILAQTMDGFADDLQNRVVGSFQRIAEGDLAFTLQPKDAQDEITPALQKTVASLQSLVEETERLSQAAVEGELTTRADASKLPGIMARSCRESTTPWMRSSDL